MKKKALPLTLVLIGAALLITTVVFWIDSSTTTEPQSFGKTLLDWVTLIAGLGASIKGWMDLFKPDKPKPPTTKIEVKGERSQVSTGDNSPNIQTETYIGTQIVQQPSEPKTPRSLNQLPSPPLDFIGREKELAQLRQNIEKGVVISGVQGMGGIGKTALGLKLAEQISPNYPDGQIYLDLRGAHEQTPLTPEQVMAHLIRSFHPETALPLDFGELGAMYRSVLSGKKALLFYDNARDEKQLDSLLPPRGCTLFVTSRQYFTLPGLVAIDLETLDSKDAVELVQEISSRVNNKDAETLAKLCGYLPLAIRAAVSVLPRRPDWSPTELIKRLSDSRARLGLVESSLSLSYDALDSELQKYLRQLGVFAAPFDKAAILAVWFDERDLRLRQLGLTLSSSSGTDDEIVNKKSPEREADDILGELLKTSLLKYDQNTNEYYFHDLTHIFLEEKVRQDENSDDVLWRYAQHYLKLASQADDDYRKGEGQYLVAIARFRQLWLHVNKISERLSIESNWKKPISAERWLERSAYTVSEMLTIGLTPNNYISYVQRSLNASRRNKNQEVESYNLNKLGLAYSALGDARKAIEYYEQALAIARDIGDRKSEGGILGNVGLAYSALGDARKAIEYYEQALAIARDIGDRKTEGMFLGNVGLAYSALGDARKAIEYYEQALAIARDIGDRKSEGGILGNVGGAYSALGDARKAIEYYEQALAIARDIGDRKTEGMFLGNVGLAYSALGDARKAIEYYEQALAIARDIGDRKTEGMFLGNVGGAYSALGDARKAIEYYEQALAIARDIGDRKSEGGILGNVGGAYSALGDARKAIEYYEQALAIARDIGDRRSESFFVSNLGAINRTLGNLDIALDFLKQGLEISKEVGDRHGEGADWDNLANVYADKQDYENALIAYKNAMDISREVGDPSLEANIAWNVATIYYEKEQYEMACKYMQITVDFENKINHPNANTDLEALNKVRAKIQNITKPEELN
ncbi:MAG: tetratricopeptide repeat protein [Anaerolineales bacterium]|nr:MAG: tetratricopeptide repeat protein [Anaerolineales bacterium]